MLCLFRIIGPSIKGNLKSKRIDNIELFLHYDSCCGWFWGIIIKWRIRITYKLVELWTHKRIKLALFATVAASIKERIHFPAMCMNVEKKLCVSLIRKNLLLNVMNLRMQNFAREYPLTVHIITRDICTIVSTYHTINVYHRNNTKLKVLAQLLGLKSRTKQKVNNSF